MPAPEPPDGSARGLHGTSRPSVLVTGFEPFGGEAVNPSMAAVRALAGNAPPGVTLHTAILPVSFRRTGPALRAAVARCRPDIVIATGQAGGRPDISVERIAINITAFGVADNDGTLVADAAVIEGGPAAYSATMPVTAVVAALHAAGVPAQVSHNAGTHLCNHVLYLLGHLAATECPGLCAGFLHLPFLPEQAARHAGQPGMALATLLAALHATVEALIRPPAG
jgi:pyroglutamyl-peptidase